VYAYTVRNASRSSGLTASQARVAVVNGTRFVADYDVSAARGDSRLDVWHVLNVVVDSGGRVRYVPVQQLRAAAP